jgi:hypothetical protein
MTDLPAALQRTLDDYKITPDTLWAAFSKTSDILRKTGEAPISQFFTLASEGAQGNKEINHVENRSGNLLGCFSLTHLRDIQIQLQTTPEIKADTHLISFVLPNQIFVIVASEHQKDLMLRVKAPTLARAMVAARKVHPDALLAFGGDGEDFNRLIREMERICSEQDFSKLDTDRRDFIDGWDTQSLLSAKKHPHLATAFFDEQMFPETYL